MVAEASSLTPWEIAEQSLLRAVLRDGSLLDKVALVAEQFARQSHRAIWLCFQTLRKAGRPIVPASVQVVLAEALADDTTTLAAAHAYVDRLYTKPVDTSIEVALEHATTIREYAKVRYAATKLDELQRMATANDPRALVGITDLAAHLAGLGTVTAWRTWNDVLEETIQNLEDRQQKRLPPPLPTGIPSLDHAQFFQAGDYIILGARTSVGKSALALRLAVHAAANKHTVLYVSMEMRDQALARRALSGHSGVPAIRLRKAELSDADWAALMAARGEQARWPVYVVDQGRRDIESIAMRARQQKMRTGLSLIVIDYIQRLHMDIPRGLSRREVIGTISGQLKDLASELECVVLALAQINRDGDSQDGGRRPVLSDLKDCGDLEQDADSVLLLSPRVGNKTYPAWRDSDPRDVLCDVAKGRDGATMDVMLRFATHMVRFEEATQ